jgi:hypothetical protein
MHVRDAEQAKPHLEHNPLSLLGACYATPRRKLNDPDCRVWVIDWALRQGYNDCVVIALLRTGRGHNCLQAPQVSHGQGKMIREALRPMASSVRSSLAPAYPAAVSQTLP